MNRVGEGQKNVPKLRFKGYEDAWEQRKLGEIVLSEIKGSAKAEMIGGDTPYLETNYLNGGECLFVDSENNVDTDDVIVLWDGSQAGTVYHGFSGALGSTFKAYKTKCLGLFIFQQLKKNQQTIYDKYRTPNIPHVIKTFKDEYDVMLTSEEEQNEIGRYFQQIDHLITLHQRKYDALKSMKKTLLSKMFPKNGEDVPEIRFKEFTDAWEQRKLESEIKDFIVPMRDKPKEFGGDIPWTRIEDIEGKYLNDTLSNQYVTEETVQLMNLNIIPKDSLIVSSSATFGVVAIVTRDLVTNQTFIGLVPNDKNTLEFWYSFFHSDEARKYMSLESVGSTIFYIAREKFEKMPVKVPKIKEMMVIGEHFNKLDQLITLHQRRSSRIIGFSAT